MGCNTVLLSPVLISKSHGYDITDYYRIDNRLGTNAEFRGLVNQFHDNGVRVVLDSVFNHCGRDFVKFKELLKGRRENADWFSHVDFTRRSPLGDPFTYDNCSGYYDLVKLNLNNPQTREYLLNAARFWIDEFDIDGMRLDSANVLDFGFMRELRIAVTDKKPDFWLMGEVVAGDYTQWVNPYTLNSVTGYMLYKALHSSHNNNNLFELANAVSRAIPQNGLPLYNFLDNHDQPRIASLVNNPLYLATLYTLLFTLPGIPSIYYGSEWELKGVKTNGSDTPLRPYIDIENSPPETEITNLIRKLSEIRRNNKALRYGAYKQIYIKYHAPYVFERYYENERILVAINIAGYEETLDLRRNASSLIDLLYPGQAAEPGYIQVKPYSMRLLKVE